MFSCFGMLDGMATGGTGQDSSGPAMPYFLALWNLVLRPPRAKYEIADLGPASFEIDGMKGRRTDLTLTTQRGMLLECSFFVPESKVKAKQPTTTQERLPVVIYLHGNSSCRVEALEVLKPLFHRRIAVFCYDSAGCGKSQGDYVSLGHYEHQDLESVVKHLACRPDVGPIGIWGRSMGAVTALLYDNVERQVSSICCDSAFSSLADLMWDIGKSQKGIYLPPWLISSVISLIRNRVRALAGFDIEDVVPLQKMKQRSLPALFVHAQADQFIPVEHSRKLYEQYSGMKEFIEIGGDHNSPRAAKIVEFVADFFSRTLRKGSKKRAPPVKPGFDGSASHLCWERGVSSASNTTPLTDRANRKVGTSQKPQSARGGLNSREPALSSNTSWRPCLRDITSMNGASTGCRSIPIEKPRRHAHPILRTPDKQVPLDMSPCGLPRCGGVPRNPSPWTVALDTSPCNLPPHGGVSRNLSPWTDCIFEDIDLLNSPGTKSFTPIKRQAQKIIDQENLPPVDIFSATKEKNAFTPGLVTPVPNGSPAVNMPHTPFLQTPLITPLRLLPSATRSGASPQVAEDPEVCLVPSLMDPMLMPSHPWPIDNAGALNTIETIAIYGATPERCHSRQRRHTIALGSPDHAFSHQAASNCRKAIPYPWLCCSVSTVHESCTYV